MVGQHQPRVDGHELGTDDAEDGLFVIQPAELVVPRDGPDLDHAFGNVDKRDVDGALPRSTTRYVSCCQGSRLAVLRS